MPGKAFGLHGGCPSGAHPWFERRSFIGAWLPYACLRTARPESYFHHRGGSLMVTIGIDAHKSSLAVALVDELGRELVTREFGNQPHAHRALYAWVVKAAPGERRFGVEGTGWVGRGIACFLLEQGEQ